PKGVAVAHAGLSNLTTWFAQRCALSPGSTMSQIASLSFDAAEREIWPPLISGARLALFDGKPVDAKEVWRWLGAEKVDVAFTPTPLANEIVARDDLEPIALRILLAGGERLLRGPKESFGPKLINNYGPTEITVTATWFEVPKNYDGAPPIGR